MRAWLQLLRVSGLLTIVTDAWAAVVVGTTLTLSAPDARWVLKQLWINREAGAWIMAAGAGCYLTGMVWNDIADAQRDRTIAPKRPLPSGRIPVAAAIVLGLILPVGALACAAQVTYGFAMCGTVIAMALLYNLWAKNIPWFGSLVMGLTRGAHALMALLIVDGAFFEQTMRSHGAGWIYPAIVTTYTIGLTLISELQHRPGRRWEALTGGSLMAMAVLCSLGLLLTVAWPGVLLHGQGAQPVVAIVGIVVVLGIVAWQITAVFKPIWQAITDSVATGFGPAVGIGLWGLLLLAALAACAAYPLAGIPALILLPFFRWASARIRMD